MTDYREPPHHPHTVHEKWLNKIVQDGQELNEWEDEFIKGLATRFEEGKQLVSRKQEESLERIYAARTRTD